MKDEEYAGFCCLAIAILCNLNADEARKMYKYGPDHPLCQKIIRKKVHRAGLENLDRKQSGKVMKELLSQGYIVDAVSEAFQCFPSTVRRRVREVREKGDEDDDGTETILKGMDIKERKSTFQQYLLEWYRIYILKERKETNGRSERNSRNFYGFFGTL